MPDLSEEYRRTIELATWVDGRTDEQLRDMLLFACSFRPETVETLKTDCGTDDE